MWNAFAGRLANDKPIHAGATECCVDSGAVEINRRLRTESTRAGICSRDLERLLDRFRIQMQKRRIDIRIEAGFHQVRLQDAIPAFVLYGYLDRRMSRQLELFLDLGWCGRMRVQSFYEMASIRCGGQRLYLPYLTEHSRLVDCGVRGRAGVGQGRGAVHGARPVAINVFEPVGLACD